MEEFQKRVIEERTELTTKIGRLAGFIFATDNNDDYKVLPLMEKERLGLQHYLMCQYRDVLNDRIAAFQETG